jgi:hypothetical protein
MDMRLMNGVFAACKCRFRQLQTFFIPVAGSKRVRFHPPGGPGLVPALLRPVLLEALLSVRKNLGHESRCLLRKSDSADAWRHVREPFFET